MQKTHSAMRSGATKLGLKLIKEELVQAIISKGYTNTEAYKEVASKHDYSERGLRNAIPSTELREAVKKAAQNRSAA